MLKKFFSVGIIFAILLSCLIIPSNIAGGGFVLGVNAAGASFNASTGILTLDDSTTVNVYNRSDEKVLSSVYGSSDKYKGNNVMYFETAMFYEGKSEVTLMYPVEEIITAYNYNFDNGIKTYTKGTDFTVTSEGKIKLTGNTTIPHDYTETQVKPTGSGALPSGVNTGQPSRQVVFVYTYKDTSIPNFKRPNNAVNKLSDFYTKLESSSSINAIFLGDSVTSGCNSTGQDGQYYTISASPYGQLSSAKTTYMGWKRYLGSTSNTAPANIATTWDKQVIAKLQKEYPSKTINSYNYAVPSSSSQTYYSYNNVDNISTITAGCPKPDIAFIAFGLNEATTDGATYSARIEKLIEWVRNKNSNCAIVLISAFGQNKWDNNTTKSANKLAEQEAALIALAEKYSNIAVAPVNTAFSGLTCKGMEDYTGNLFNHPNDFGVNLYAEIINTTISKSAINTSGGNKYSADANIINAMNKYKEDTIKNSGLNVDDENITGSIYNQGNDALVANVIKKAMDGKDITIVAFGGSITQGSGAGAKPTSFTHGYTDTKNYVQLVGDWFGTMFKSYGGKVNMVNAGIGATDTVFGIHRMNEDVLAHNPDLVILEWDKNDAVGDTKKQATYENMMRKFLEKNIAVVLLGMCGGDGSSSQALHEPLSTHYSVPYISYKNAFKNEAYLSKLTNDNVHPNIVGHHLTALLLNSYFAGIYEKINTVSATTYTLPKNPYNSEATLYGNGVIAKLTDIESGKFEGVKLVSKGSFVKNDKVITHGNRKYSAYIAKYADSYEPMVLEIKDLNTLFFMVERSYGISDGSFTVKIDGNEVKDSSFSSSHSSSADNSQIERTYIWATARAYYSQLKKSIKVEIYPTNKEKDEYVGLYGLFLTGNFKSVAEETTGDGSGNNSSGNDIIIGGDVSNGDGFYEPDGSYDSDFSDETDVENLNSKDSELKSEVASVQTIVEAMGGFFFGPNGIRNLLLVWGGVLLAAAAGIVTWILIKKKKAAKA